VDSAPRIGVAVEMLRSMMPDLGVVDLRGASRERAADLESLRSSFPEGPTIVVGAADRLGPLLHPSAGRVEALVTEPVDFGELFAEIASLLPPSRAGIPTKRLSPPTSVAVRRVTEQYQDHTLRVEHLSAAAGLSVDHFAHVFSDDMGIPPMEYVVRVRVQAAIFQLRENLDKVSTIARRLGFYDGPHLPVAASRAFGETCIKRAGRYTPGESRGWCRWRVRLVTQ